MQYKTWFRITLKGDTTYKVDAMLAEDYAQEDLEKVLDKHRIPATAKVASIERWTTTRMARYYRALHDAQGGSA